MTTIPLPERCLTLLPPWPQAIRYAEKRLENRSYGVAKPLADWRYALGLGSVPIIGLSQSKKTDNDEVRFVAGDLKERGLWRNDEHVSYGDVRKKAGTLWLCAELLDVLPPDKCEGDPWHVPGQWGLILGRVWEVEPVPCTGGVGCWKARYCHQCAHVQADSQGDKCRGCKAVGTLCESSTFGDWLDLEVVTEVV
jgi:hypothetical protein